jgi:hypothetical protein
MRKVIFSLVVAVLMACGNDEGGATDPYAIIWVRNHLSDSVAADTFYKLLLVRVNQDSLVAHVGDVNRGEQQCVSYAGYADDSLAIQMWLAPYAAGDTLRSSTFMPLTGPTPDSAAHWGVIFTDTAVILEEEPDSFPPCIF